MITALSWIAFLVGLGGLWRAGKHRSGWFIAGVASWIWATWALLTNTWALMITTILWSIVEFRNWHIWSRDE